MYSYTVEESHTSLILCYETLREGPNDVMHFYATSTL